MSLAAIPLLLQRDVFSEDEICNAEEIIRKYFDVSILDDSKLHFDRKSLKGYPGVFRGSLFLASAIGRDIGWTNALKWAPAFAQDIVSSDYSFVDVAKLVSDPQYKWPMFIRPSAGNKPFSGNVFTKDSFINEYRFFVDNRNGNPFEICLHASPVKIRREWRTIFVNRAYSSGSQYMVDSEKVLSPDVPHAVIDFAIKLSANPFLDNLFDFVIDICETPDGLRLVELNHFETSSFYAADLDKVYSDWALSVINEL